VTYIRHRSTIANSIRAATCARDFARNFAGANFVAYTIIRANKALRPYVRRLDCLAILATKLETGIRSLVCTGAVNAVKIKILIVGSA
jgi:hypothetical protein